MEVLQFLKARYRRRRRRKLTPEERAEAQREVLVKIDNGSWEDDVNIPEAAVQDDDEGAEEEEESMDTDTDTE